MPACLIAKHKLCFKYKSSLGGGGALPLGKYTKQRRSENQCTRLQVLLGSSLIVRARERKADVKRAPRPSSFCWVPHEEGNGNVASLCSCGLQLLPAGSEMRLFLPLCRLLLLFGRTGNQSWDSGLSTQRRADFIFEREMPSGTLPKALDLNRHKLLGRTEG